MQPILEGSRSFDLPKAPAVGQPRNAGATVDPEIPVVGSADRPYATVVTFNPHPQEFFTGRPKQLLTPPTEKASQLRAMGVEQLVLLPFDRELADLSPQQFVEDILVRQLQIRRVSVGEDFRFGRKRAGTAQDLQAIAAKFGIDTQIVPLYTDGVERISSSNIRNALQVGDLERANQLLGRPYAIAGAVETGQQLGRTIGFPTANLKIPPEKFLPRWGVYGVEVESPCLVGQGGSFARRGALSGVMNIGCRPTVAGERPTVEVHLLDWSGDLYGKTLKVHLKTFLRPEQKFESLDALKQQITADCTAARSILDTGAQSS